jgi:hypothetical protein
LASSLESPAEIAKIVVRLGRFKKVKEFWLAHG